MQVEIRNDLMSLPSQVKQKYEQAWDDATKVRQSICATINKVGHNPRPGIIDLHGVEPILGEQWSLIEREF